MKKVSLVTKSEREIRDCFIKSREAKQLSQKDVAEFLDVSIVTVSNWECCKKLGKMELYAKLEALYDVSLKDLFLLDEHNSNDKKSLIKEVLNTVIRLLQDIVKML